MLLVEGGIYSDTDTRVLQPPSKWGHGATLWADGKGLSKQERARISAGEGWEDVVGPPSIVVGVEADVGEREDWHDWWARPVSCSSDARLMIVLLVVGSLADRVLVTTLTPRSRLFNGRWHRRRPILSCSRQSLESYIQPRRQ
jgi:hypothetical protein